LSYVLCAVTVRYFNNFGVQLTCDSYNNHLYKSSHKHSRCASTAVNNTLVSSLDFV